MKKIKLLFVALFLLMATIANAQFANSSALSGSAVGSSDIEGGWSGITASYNSNTWDVDDGDFDNILACGRIISAPQGDGWEVARVIPVCALTGEAAGKAAAYCVKTNRTVNRITYQQIP